MRPALVLLLAGQLCACSSTAALRRQDGTRFDARIVGSDANNLYLADSTDGTTKVSREQLQDIDHPGNVLVMAGLGVLLVGVQIITSEHQTGTDAVGTAVATGLPGLAMITWGGSNYLRSNAGAANFQRESVRLVTPDPNRPYLPAPTWATPVR